MDGMLSQDEINALLQGMDLSDTADGGDAAADPTPENSTAENYNNENEAAENAAPVVSDGEELTDVEDGCREGCDWRGGQYQYGILCHNPIFTGKPQSKYYNSCGYAGYMEKPAGRL